MPETDARARSCPGRHSIDAYQQCAFCVLRSASPHSLANATCTCDSATDAPHLSSNRRSGRRRPVQRDVAGAAEGRVPERQHQTGRSPRTSRLVPLSCACRCRVLLNYDVLSVGADADRATSKLPARSSSSRTRSTECGHCRRVVIFSRPGARSPPDICTSIARRAYMRGCS